MKPDEKNLFTKKDSQIYALANRSLRLLDFWGKEYNFQIPFAEEEDLCFVTERSPEEQAKRVMSDKKGTPEEFVARDYADLENDFNFVKKLNEKIAISHAQLMDRLPTVEEMNVLIGVMEEISADNKEFYKKHDKEYRLANARLLKDAALKITGAK